MSPSYNAGWSPPHYCALRNTFIHKGIAGDYYIIIYYNRPSDDYIRATPNIIS